MYQRRYNVEFETNLSPEFPSSDEDWSRVRIQTNRGRVESFVAQYEIVTPNQTYPVVRYDCAHGFVHRDVLNRRGDIVDKQPYAEQVDLNAALNDALADLTSEWESYRARFLS